MVFVIVLHHHIPLPLPPSIMDFLNIIIPTLLRLVSHSLAMPSFHILVICFLYYDLSHKSPAHSKSIYDISIWENILLTS